MNAYMISFSLVSWNIRGLGDDDKCTMVKDTLSAAQPNIVCLQESKLSSTDALKTRASLPPHISGFCCVDAAATRGGLVTAWDKRSFSLTSFITCHHTLTTAFASTASDYCFTVTNGYMPSDHRDSLAFLEDLEEVVGHVGGNWVVAGDFNLTRGVKDNSNGVANTTLCDAFNDTIHKLCLIDLPLLDRLFTWSNHRESPTLAHLDRVFFNVPMSTTFPDSSLLSLPKPTSDHTPIHLRFSTAIPKTNLFRFENAWLKHPEFLPIILPAWSNDNERGAAATLVSSLKAIRGASKVWAQRMRAPPFYTQTASSLYTFLMSSKRILRCLQVNFFSIGPVKTASCLLSGSA
jgi:exonuclease III